MKDRDFLKDLEDSIMEFKKNKELAEINSIVYLLSQTGISIDNILSHISNILIEKCQKNGVKKERFFQLMNRGWDYHEQKSKKNDR